MKIADKYFILKDIYRIAGKPLMDDCRWIEWKKGGRDRVLVGRKKR